MVTKTLDGLTKRTYALVQAILKGQKMDTQPQDILTLVRTVARSLRIRNAVDSKRLRALFDAKRFTDLAGEIKTQMHLDMGLKIGYVNSGGKESNPAWIAIPQRMPPYGTEAFRRLVITIFIRKSFLKKARFETVVKVIAHELSHVVLAALNHPLQTEERAVDATAMVLGFAEYYERGAEQTTISDPVEDLQLPRMLSVLWHIAVALGMIACPVITTRFGYLHRHEIDTAAKEIRRLRRI